MSVTAEHIRALMALGIDGEKLLAVVEIIDDASRHVTRDASLSSRDASQEPSRSSRDTKSLSAERSRAYRLRQRVARHAEPSRSSRDAENADILTSLSSSLLTEETLKKERKKESSGIRARDASAVPDDWPADYGDLFWQAYPRKEEKIAAMKKLAILRKSGIVTFSDLMAGVDRYCSVKREPQFIKQPTVWLNKGCWADETQTGARNVERSDDKPKTGHDAIFAVFARKARELAGDGPVAGAAGEDEFPIGDGSYREPKDVSPGAFKRSSEAHDWRESFSLEGEIIPPDKATAGLPNGRERR